MFYFLYKTTNTLNNSYYIGRHKSNVLDDSYLGSGTWLNRSIKKYGRENFKREILSFHESLSAVKEAEAILLSQHIGLDGCMNLNPSAGGGWEYVNTIVLPKMKKLGIYKSADISGDKNPMYGKTHSEKSKKQIGDNLREKYNTPEWRQKHRDTQLALDRKKSLTERSKQSHSIRTCNISLEKRLAISKALTGKPSGNKGKVSLYSQEYSVNIGCSTRTSVLF